MTGLDHTCIVQELNAFDRIDSGSENFDRFWSYLHSRSHFVGKYLGDDVQQKNGRVMLQWLDMKEVL